MKPRRAKPASRKRPRLESKKGKRGAPPAGPVGDPMLDTLLRLVAQQLDTSADAIDINAQLSALGFSSIGLIALAAALNDACGLELSPAIFYEYTTVRQLAEHLVAGATRPAGADPSAQSPGRGREPVAITGVSLCFPGAQDIHAFWDLLRSEREAIREIPADRWDWREIYGDPREAGNKTQVNQCGFIDGVAEFDSLFFNISPREAELMDPQQRLLLTHAWRAIEDAGHAAQSLYGSQTGVFIGTVASGYCDRLIHQDHSIEGYNGTGAAASMGPNRVSYLLDFHGPSEPVDTACSSSLVAIHRAVRAIQAGDCEQALAGGVSCIISPWEHISMTKAGMLSADGRCRTFSKDANGYGRGEGVGVLFLKPLSAAERDHDHIYGLIIGTAENHGGRSSSLTAPNPLAQAELVKAALREADIDPRSVNYIEAHGTGTPLGDPVEINGLRRAFDDLCDAPASVGAREFRCGLGSVKSNIGHLEIAAGVAGVIKILLQMKHQTLVKSLHCEEINPHIRLEGTPFYVVQETESWHRTADADGRELPRRAGVSSFGFGGVNAHVVIEEYRAPAREASRVACVTQERPALVILSAKNEARLTESAGRLLTHLLTHSYSDMDLRDIAYTLQVGRNPMEHRLAFTAATLNELIGKLQSFAGCYQGEVAKNNDTAAVLVDSDMTARTIASWIAGGEYNELLVHWVKGLTVDWQQLYYGRTAEAAAKPRRLSLPTYPFAKERHWALRESSGPTLDPAANSDRMFYTRIAHELRSRKISVAEALARTAHRRGDSQSAPS